MTKLKLGSFLDDKPVKLSIELPASIYRDLVAYGELLAKNQWRRRTNSTGQTDRADAGTLHHDRSGLCEGEAVGVINLPVT